MKKSCPICNRISITKTGRCSACGHQLAKPHQATTVAKVWIFPSSSSSRTYQTLQYTDGSTSCDCPGWTRRAPTNAQGAIVRTCRHVRFVDLGTADTEAADFTEYEKTGNGTTGRPVNTLSPPISFPVSAIRSPVSLYAQRKLAL